MYLCSEAKDLCIEIDVQRSSPDGRVEPQAYGGRKIPLSIYIEMDI